jgi:Putative Ig domain
MDPEVEFHRYKIPSTKPRNNMKPKKLLSLVSALLSAVCPAQADLLVTYNFDNSLAPTSPLAGVNAANAVLTPGSGANSTTLTITKVVATSNSSNGGTAVGGFGGRNNANNQLAPITFELTAPTGSEITVNSIRIVGSMSGSGTLWAVRTGFGVTGSESYTTGGWTTNAAAGSVDVDKAITPGPVIITEGTSQKFHVDLARSTASGNCTFDVDYIEVNGSVVVTTLDPVIVGYSIDDATYIAGDTIATNSPTVANGTTTGFSVDPALPAGLSFDLITGEITGTPTAAAADATYTVTATFDTAATDDHSLQIEVIEPKLASYTPNTSTTVAGQTITGMSPLLVGGTLPLSYSIDPPLPAGLNFDTNTGVISGAATVLHTTTVHTITADYATYADTTAAVTITVNAPAFNGYVDQTEYLLGTGNAMRSAPPKLVGTAPTGFTIAPALPTGLVIDSITGVISGTPAAASAEATYTVTATYAGFPSVDQNITITAIDGVADDFNNATGTIGNLPHWTTQLTGNSDIEYLINGPEGWIAGSPSGTRYSIAGATATNDLTALPANSDFTASVRIASEGNFTGGGMTFGYVPESNGYVPNPDLVGDPNNNLNTDGGNDNFWSFQIEYNSGVPSVVVKTRNAAVNTTIIDEPTGNNFTINDSFYTMIVSYDADTTNLKFTVLNPNGGTWYQKVYSMDAGDLAIATGSLIGIQTRSSFRVGFEDFQVSFAEVDITDPVTNSFAQWIGAGGFNLTGGDAAFNFDFDNDGVSNGEEWYFFGTDPTLAQSHASALTAVAASGIGSFTFTHSRPLATTGVTAEYEWSTLLSGTWNASGATAEATTVTISAIGDDPDQNSDPDYESITVTVTADPTTAPKVFVRMKLVSDAP